MERDFLVERLVVGPIQSNAYLVYLRDDVRALLIDAGEDADNILRALSKQGGQLEKILLTHGHFDHILAAREVAEATGAEIFIGDEDAPMLMSAEACLLPKAFARKPFAPISAVPLREGQFPLKVIKTPGHTRGGVSFYFEEEGVLFTGDTLFLAGVGRTDLPGGDQDVLIQSLKELFTLPPETVIYPGHGEPSTIGEEKARYAL